MKKFIKITSICLGILIVILYLSFLFILPNVIDLNKYKSELQKIVKEQTNLIIDFNNPKITTTPLLSAGIMAENISIKLPDNSDVLTADSFKGRISLPSLIFLTIKVSTAEINNPSINIDIINGKAFKAVQAYEEILNKKEENIATNIQTDSNTIFNPSLIKIIIPKILINNYVAQINDLKTGNYLKIKGNEMILGYRNGKSASIKTLAELYVNETKNITANIDIDSFLPPPTVLDKEDDKAQRVEIPFINPVAMYMAYDLKTNIDSKIKIRTKNNQIVSNGYLNVDNFTLNIDGIQIPESKFHLTTKGTKANIDSDLHITDSEKIRLLGLINYSKKPLIDMEINSDEIYINDVISLIKAILNSLHIKNELNNIRGEGYFSINSKVKTDFKKLKSEGNILVKNCIIKNIKDKTTLAKINSTISLDNSILKFIDTSVEIAETIFKIDGTIDEKSIMDISVFMEKMPIEKVFKFFLSEDINKIYNVNSGYINLKADIKGELKNAIANLKLSINNLSLTDKVNNINYINNILTANFNSDFKKYTGEINNSNFKVIVNNTIVGCDKFNLSIDEKNIIIAPAKLKINNSTIIDFEGYINNYIKNPEFSLNANGNLISKDIKELLGNDLAIYIKEKGTIPLNISIIGNSKKQTLETSIEANKDNYFTFMDIENLQNQNTILKTVVDFKGDRLKIKDTGLYIKREIPDSKNPEKTTIEYEDIINIDGTITKLNTSEPNINLIKVKMPKEINASICAFPQSKLTTKGNLFIFGNLSSPRIRGDFNIWNMSIPELFLSVKKVAAKFEGKDLDINIKDINANESDYNVLINADLNSSKNFIIKNLNLVSINTDADKLMKISEALAKYMPQNNTSEATKTSLKTTNNIPVIIKDGNIDIKQIKTGNIILTDTTGKISLNNDTLYIDNLVTNAFKGKIKGNVAMNIITSEIIAKLKGNGLDVEKTLLDAAAMKDTLTGTMNFDTDISLKGYTYEEQMKSLKGKLTFIMKDGQLGPFGKLENLIMAENIRESAFFQTATGSVINSLLSFNTSHYNTLKGDLSFENGITLINPITSSGDIMGMYIFGDYNLLKNEVDINVRGRLGSQVSDSLGPLAILNPVNLVKATPGMSLVLGKIFFLFCETVTPEELDLIPLLGKEITDNNTTKFQVIIRGDAAKPLSLVKSFKWLALESEINAAKEYLNTIPTNTKPINIEGFESINTENIKSNIEEKTKNKIKEATSNIITEETKIQIEETKGTVNKLKNLFSNKENIKNTIKEQVEQTQQNTINQQIQQQALNQTVTTDN